jgi:SAM-dependent methyltransferase
VLRTRGLEAAPSLDAVGIGSVDLVFSSNVLEHIEDDVEVLRQLHRKLKPGSHLALWIPAFPFLWTSLDNRVGHFRRYTVPSAQRMLQSAGFRTYQTCCYQDSVGFVATLIFKFVGGKDATLTAGAVRMFDRVLFPVSRRLDSVVRHRFGKNVYVVAVKDMH